MKWFSVIACLLGCISASAEMRVPVPMLAQEAPRGWLGLEVSKPDEGVTAHVPSLPPGIGFVVRTITKDGPAEAAGLRELDIIWKLGDQMLVNEGQLAALLRLSKPGDKLTFAGFRGGKPIDFSIKLGEAPASRNVFPGDLVESAILPVESSSPMRIVDVQEKLASYRNTDGRAEVRKEGVIYQVKIIGPKNEPIYEGNLPQDGNLEAIPQDWRRKVHALRRGLDQALNSRMVPLRQPRPRVVPPPPRQP